MKVLIDMNLSVLWVDFLALHGVEAVHWSSIGPVNAADDVLIGHASEHSQLILTNDLDFGITLITQGRAEPSVIQLRSDDLLPSAMGPSVMDAITNHAAALERGALVTIDPVRERIRFLNLAEDW